MRISAADARRLGALPKAKPKTEAQKALMLAGWGQWESVLATKIQNARFQKPYFRQYPFLSGRKFRADFAFPEQMLLIEVDGGLYIQGGHSRGAARESDLERDALAMLAGWRTLRVSPRHVKDGRAIAWIAELLEKP